MKKEKYVEYMKSMESLQNRVIEIGQLISQNLSYKDLVEYPDRIMKISRDDIIKVAKEYIGENRLVLYSKMGFPKKEKIEKPGFKPLVANTTAVSPFVKMLSEKQDITPKYVYINFKEDIKEESISKNINLYYSMNPVNPIFTCVLRFGIGEKELPMLKYASQMLSLSGAGDMLVSDFKKEMASIGCNYEISSDQSFLTVTVEGLEENMSVALKHIYTLLAKPNISDDKLKVIYDQEKAARQMEKSEPDNVADALYDWIRYGNKSDYIDRLTLKEIKSLNIDSLKAVIYKSIQYEMVVHYCGKQPFAETKATISAVFGNHANVFPSKSPVVMDINKYKANEVFFVNKSGSTQSKIYFMINTPESNPKEKPLVSAFNLYFGGDFSGLVMQYVREYRSMAYAAGAVYSTPMLSGKPSIFMGYIGTQADKTFEAVALFDSLVRHMPEFPDRMENIRNYLIHSSVSERPSFRDLSQTIEKWRWLGYEKDPLEFNIPVYMNMQFDEIVKFNKERLSATPMVIGIVGNKKNIDLKKLSMYGTISLKKEKDLFRD